MRCVNVRVKTPVCCIEGIVFKKPEYRWVAFGGGREKTSCAENGDIVLVGVGDETVFAAGFFGVVDPNAKPYILHVRKPRGEIVELYIENVRPVVDYNVLIAAVTHAIGLHFLLNVFDKDVVVSAKRLAEVLEEAARSAGLPWPPSIIVNVTRGRVWVPDSTLATLAVLVDLLDQYAKKTKKSIVYKKTRATWQGATCTPQSTLYIVYRIETPPHLLPAVRRLLREAAARGLLYIDEKNRLVTCQEMVYQLIELGATVNAKPAQGNKVNTLPA